MLVDSLQNFTSDIYTIIIGVVQFTISTLNATQCYDIVLDVFTYQAREQSWLLLRLKLVHRRVLEYLALIQDIRVQVLSSPLKTS